jgi:hypothetical protein
MQRAPRSVKFAPGSPRSGPWFAPSARASGETRWGSPLSMRGRGVPVERDSHKAVASHHLPNFAALQPDQISRPLAAFPSYKIPLPLSCCTPHSLYFRPRSHSRPPISSLAANCSHSPVASPPQRPSFGISITSPLFNSMSDFDPKLISVDFAGPCSRSPTLPSHSP